MMQEIEIEYKNLLTKDEFNHILHNYPFPKNAVKQTNYYFETDGLSLKENGSALRIREKDGNYVLTLKQPHPNGLLETHDFLTKDEACNWINGDMLEKTNTNKQLKKMNISVNDLVYYGSLTTERRELNYDDVLLVLDSSMYNGRSDYELEIEAPSEEIGMQFFNNFLRKNNIDKKKTPNKIERFFQTR